MYMCMYVFVYICVPTHAYMHVQFTHEHLCVFVMYTLDVCSCADPLHIDTQNAFLYLYMCPTLIYVCTCTYIHIHMYISSIQRQSRNYTHSLALTHAIHENLSPAACSRHICSVFSITRFLAMTVLDLHYAIYIRAHTVIPSAPSTFQLLLLYI